MISLNTNIDSLNANKNLFQTTSNISKSIEKLGSGLQILRASDDPSGLAIADNLRHQYRAVHQSTQNANSAISLLQIADRAMSEQSNILDTIKQKLIQGSNDTTSLEGRKILSQIISKQLQQFDQIAMQTRFEDQYLLQASQDNMSKTTKIAFVLGENYQYKAEARDGIQANTKGLGVNGTLSLETLKNLSASINGLSKENMNDYINTIDKALSELNSFRSDYGSVQQQVYSSWRNLLTQEVNLTNAESIIRDVDYAKESSTLKQSLIIYQTGSFALTQSNLAKDYILNLLSNK